MGQFELNWVGEYIPRLISENDFLNQKLEDDTYGIYYSVLFEGDADTYLMQAKKAPEEGVPEWGMIGMAKSGKSKRFKRVKKDDSGTQEGGPPASQESKVPRGAAADKYLKDTSDVPRSLVIELLKYYDVQSLYNSPKYMDMIKLAQSLNDDIMSMIKGNRGESDADDN